MPCGSIHIVADDRISFFFMAGSYSIVYIYNVCIMCIYILYYNIMFNSLYLIYNYINVIYIIYAYILYIYTKSSLSITFCNEHLAYFHILAVMLLWTLGCICLFELVFSLFSDIHPGVQFCWIIMVVLLLVFWGTSMLFSTVGAPICIPTNSVQEFQLFTSSPTCVIYGLFDDNHSDRCGVLSHCACDLHFMSLPFWIQSIFSVQCVSRLCLYWTLDTLKNFVPRRIL